MRCGNERPVTPAWTLTGGVGTIGTQDGRLTAVTTGVGTVVATIGALSGVAEVRVAPGALAAIDLAAPGDVRVGETRPVGWTGADANGTEVVVRPRWEVTGGVGRVDAEGRFVAASPGNGRIVARSGDVSAEAPVRVLPGPLADLRIVRDPDRADVTAGERIQLSVVGQDEDGHAVDVEPRWEIVRGAGSIDAAGQFVPTRAGPAEIRVTSGSLAAEAEMNVAPGALASIVVAPVRANVASDTTQAFTAAGRDAYGNLVDIDPDWSVTYGVGGMDAEGRFSGTMAGTGVVSATAGGVVGTADVATTPGTLAVLEVRPAAPDVSSGELLQFQTDGFDARGNTVTGYAVEWQVSGDVGTVEPARGIFTGLAAGIGQVRAQSNGVAGTTEVRVVPGSPSAATSTVTVSPAAVPASGGAAAEITVTVRDNFNNLVAGAPVRVVSSRAAGHHPARRIDDRRRRRGPPADYLGHRGTFDAPGDRGDRGAGLAAADRVPLRSATRFRRRPRPDPRGPLPAESCAAGSRPPAGPGARIGPRPARGAPPAAPGGPDRARVRALESGGGLPGSQRPVRVPTS